MFPEYEDFLFDTKKTDYENELIKNYAPEFCQQCEHISVKYSIGENECFCLLDDNNPPDSILECKLTHEEISWKNNLAKS